VEYEGKTATAEIIGTNEQSLLIVEQTIQSGTFFTKQHVEGKDNVTVLSPEAKDFFFQQGNPCGTVIRINNIPFTVIGVLAPPRIKGKFEGIGLPKIEIPFTTFQKYFGDRFDNIMLSTYTSEQVPVVVRQLEKIFRAMHVLEEGEPNDFMIQDTQTFAAAAEDAAKSIGLFTLLAAIIALLVGGIGVMNIMLVAVQERTKEIGIKAALGATRNVIRLQFLIEAVAICIIGGIIGVAFGAGAAIALNRWFGVLTILELTPVLVSLFFTAMIGLVFGLYPAEKAARLNPVEALTDY
jgi:putative ABC transport system permease protein